VSLLLTTEMWKGPEGPRKNEVKSQSEVLHHKTEREKSSSSSTKCQ
jgi:hypothetical protein